MSSWDPVSCLLNSNICPVGRPGRSLTLLQQCRIVVCIFIVLLNCRSRNKEIKILLFLLKASVPLRFLRRDLSCYPVSVVRV